MRCLLSRFTACALLAVVAAAQARPAATLVGRESVVHLQHQGGFATVGSGGEEGSTLPVTTLSPATLALAGSHHHEGRYLGWDVAYDHGWSLSQTWSLDAAASRITASGSMVLSTGGTVFGPNCTPCSPSLLVAGLNAQAFDFTLDASTRYEFRSLTTPQQWVDLLTWDDAAQAWLYVWAGFVLNEGIAWERTGVLDAGLYRLRNNRDDVRIGASLPQHASSWDWSMTLPDASVSAVPEPGAAGMFGAGLLLIGGRRLRRVAAAA